MIINGDSAPSAAFELRNIAQGFCDVVLFDEVTQTQTDTEDGTQGGFEWREYTVKTPYREGLASAVTADTAAWLALGKQSESDTLAAEVRAERDKLLTACDWTVCTDAKTDKTAWKAYRQALRDIPKSAGFPYVAIFPAAPEV